MQTDTSLLTPEFLETIPCNLCGSVETKLWGESEGFKIVECCHCGLVYVNPRLNRAGLQKVYGVDYYQMHGEDKARALRIKMYDIEVKELQKLVKPGKILDVGCGGGFFLSRLGEGWEKFGTEFNPAAAEDGRVRFGLDVKLGPLPELDYKDNSFDVINMRGVIEHFQDPFSYLTTAYRILKPGGMLAINTPNIGSLCARLYKVKFNLVTPKYHIYYFSTKTMTEMLVKAGFKIVCKKYFYIGTPYAKWSDPFRIPIDMIRLRMNPAARLLSPAFFDNVLHIYAAK